MRNKFETLAICILIPLAVGALSNLFTQGNIMQYANIAKPALSPSAIVFPIVWTILYLLMGISSYLIITSENKSSKIAIRWYIIQLFINFFWSIIFFNFNNYLLAFIWLILLIIAVIIMIIQFYKIKPLAAYLQIPYLLWCLFAAYLNFSIYLLNK